MRAESEGDVDSGSESESQLSESEGEGEEGPEAASRQAGQPEAAPWPASLNKSVEAPAGGALGPDSAPTPDTTGAQPAEVSAAQAAAPSLLHDAADEAGMEPGESAPRGQPAAAWPAVRVLEDLPVSPLPDGMGSHRGQQQGTPPALGAASLGRDRGKGRERDQSESDADSSLEGGELQGSTPVPSPGRGAGSRQAGLQLPTLASGQSFQLPAAAASTAQEANHSPAAVLDGCSKSSRAALLPMADSANSVPQYTDGGSAPGDKAADGSDGGSAAVGDATGLRAMKQQAVLAYSSEQSLLAASLSKADALAERRSSQPQGGSQLVHPSAAAASAAAASAAAASGAFAADVGSAPAAGSGSTRADARTNSTGGASNGARERGRSRDRKVSAPALSKEMRPGAHLLNGRPDARRVSAGAAVGERDGASRRNPKGAVEPKGARWASGRSAKSSGARRRVDAAAQLDQSAMWKPPLKPPLGAPLVKRMSHVAESGMHWARARARRVAHSATVEELTMVRPIHMRMPSNHSPAGTGACPPITAPQAADEPRACAPRG